MIIRVAKRSRYVSIRSETLEDARLSYRARGVLAFLLSKPDNWEASEAHLASQSTDGTTAVRSALNELKTFGYLHCYRLQGDGGHFSWLHYLFEEPIIGSPPFLPLAGNPQVVNPQMVNPREDNPLVVDRPLTNTDAVINEETNTDATNNLGGAATPSKSLRIISQSSTNESQSKPESKRVRKTPLTAFPAGFVPSDSMREWAWSKVKCLYANAGVLETVECGADGKPVAFASWLAAQTEKFENHHRAKGSTFSDWESAWRTWISNGIEYAAKDPRFVHRIAASAAPQSPERGANAGFGQSVPPAQKPAREARETDAIDSVIDAAFGDAATRGRGSV